MTGEEFAHLKEDFEAHEDALLRFKRTQYAADGDRLKNFRLIGELLGLRPEQVAVVYMAKHFQSIAQQVMEDTYEWAWETDRGEGLKQRIADLRNYGLLLAGCLEEAIERLEGIDEDA